MRGSLHGPELHLVGGCRGVQRQGELHLERAAGLVPQHLGVELNPVAQGTQGGASVLARGTLCELVLLSAKAVC